MAYRSIRILIAALLLVLACSAYAAAPQKATPPKNITLELTDTTVVEALESLFKGTNLSYILQPGVGGTISSLRLKDVSFERALNALVKAAGLEVTIDDGIYLIGKDVGKPTPSSTPAEVKPEPAAISPDEASKTSSGPPRDRTDVPILSDVPIPGPEPEPSPVYYGHYPPPPAYYGYGPMYGYGYGYNPYQPLYTPPAYQVYRPTVLPPPGVPWSAGIGRVQIISPPNRLIPLPQR